MVGQSRRQTAMHNLVRNRWDAVYWNIHYNFSPFFSLFSPIATPEAKRCWPRRLPTQGQPLIHDKYRGPSTTTIRPATIVHISSLGTFHCYGYVFSTNGRRYRENFISFFTIFSIYCNRLCCLKLYSLRDAYIFYLFTYFIN